MARINFSKDGPAVFRDRQSLTKTISNPLVAQEGDKDRLAALLKEGADVLITEMVPNRGARLAWRLPEYYPEKVDGSVQVFRIYATSLESTKALLTEILRKISPKNSQIHGLSSAEIQEHLSREIESLQADQVVIVYDHNSPDILSTSDSPQTIFDKANEHDDTSISMVGVLPTGQSLPEDHSLTDFSHLELGPYSPDQLSTMVEERLSSAFLSDAVTEDAKRCCIRLAKMYGRPLPSLSLLLDIGKSIEKYGGSLPITATEVANALRERRYKELKWFAFAQSDHARLLLRGLGELTAEGRTPVSTRTLLDRYETICKDIWVSSQDESTLQQKLRELRSGPSPYDGLVWHQQQTRQNERGGKYNTYRLAADVDLELIDSVLENPISEEDRQNFRERFYFAGLSGTAEKREAESRRHDLNRVRELERHWEPPDREVDGNR